MERLIKKQLIDWINNSNKPLILYGARQVGKTYIVKEIAEEYFLNKYIYINFFENNILSKELKDKTSPEDILSTISDITQIQINDDFLLIFDEIQELPNLKTSLKLFNEQNYKLKIICLGSYLANTLHQNKYSFPVGKVQSLYMYPLNFYEFLLALNRNDLVNKILNFINNQTKLTKLDHHLILDIYYDFLLVGGMPEVVDIFIKTKDFKQVNSLKQELYNNYQTDLIKYINKESDKLKSLSIFNNINTFLAKENNKYQLTKIKTTARYLNYAQAIQGLLITKIIYKINNLKKLIAPLQSKILESEFKIYYNDVGFLSLTFNLNRTILNSENNNYNNIKGSLAENFVISQLMMQTNNLYYYSFRGNENIDELNNNSNTEYEIDLCIEDMQANVIPIEIKYGENFSKKSLNKIIKQNQPKASIIFSSQNYKYDDENKIYYLPIYLASFLKIEDNRISLSNFNKEHNE